MPALPAGALRPAQLGRCAVSPRARARLQPSRPRLHSPARPATAATPAAGHPAETWSGPAPGRAHGEGDVVLYVDALDASFFPCGRDLLAEFLAFKADIVFQADDFDWRAPRPCGQGARRQARCAHRLAAAARRGRHAHGSARCCGVGARAPGGPRRACGGRGLLRAALVPARSVLRARARGVRAPQAQREGRDQERPVPQAAAGRAPQLQARAARGALRCPPRPRRTPPARAQARCGARRLLCAGAWMGRVGAVRHYLSQFFLAAGHIDGRAWDDQGCALLRAHHGPRPALQSAAGRRIVLGYHDRV